MIVQRDRIVVVTAVVASLGAGACGSESRGEQEWEASIDTLANGAVRTSNRGTGMWADGERWRLVEELRIGSMDGHGPDVFGDLHSLSLAVDPDGRMLVLDGQVNEIRVFDPSGEHVGSFGRAGAGPGEVRSASIAGWGQDGNLWIVDAGNGRYSAFTASGEFVETRRRQVSYSMTPWPGTIDADGRILDIGIRGHSEQAIVRIDPPSQRADTFPLPQYDGGKIQMLNSAGFPVRSVTIPFAGNLSWRLDHRGYVWSSITDRYRIAQQTLAGDTLRIIELAQAPVAVSAQERVEALEMLKEMVQEDARADASVIPGTKPFIGDIMLDDRGHLWISPWRAEGRAYDVFDPDGRYLGEVATSTRLSTWAFPPVFRGDLVYGFTFDEMMVPYLVRMRIERGGG